MNLNSIVDDLVNAAELLVPLIVPGAGPAIQAGKAILNVIDRVKDGVDDPAKLTKLQGGRDALEQRVNAHADRVIDSLGDRPGT